MFLKLIANAKSRSSPWRLRDKARAAWFRRWSAIQSDQQQRLLRRLASKGDRWAGRTVRFRICIQSWGLRRGQHAATLIQFSTSFCVSQKKINAEDSVPSTLEGNDSAQLVSDDWCFCCCSTLQDTVVQWVGTTWLEQTILPEGSGPLRHVRTGGLVCGTAYVTGDVCRRFHFVPKNCIDFIPLGSSTRYSGWMGLRDQGRNDIVS